MTTTKPLRILHLASSHRWTGAAEPASDLASAQIELGHRVQFACVKGHSFWRRLEDRGIPLIEGFYFQPRANVAQLRADVTKLRKLIRKNRFDVIHCHLAHDHWVAGSALRSPLRKLRKDGHRPLLVRTFHRDRPPRRDPLSRWLYTSVTDLIVTVSEPGKIETIQRLGADPAKVEWIRGAVDTERFHPGLDPSINRELWKIPADAPVAGIVARMQAYRGHLEFIDSLDDIIRSVPEARYIVSGRGEIKRKVDEKLRNHRLREHLIRAGYRKKDLPETYAAMDVSVLLARGSDGTCRAMLEAMACGRPVIGLREGAIADTIEHGRTGWLVDPDRRDASLREALVEALSDRARCRRMGKRARARVEEEFTHRKRAQATIAAYRKAVTRQKKKTKGP